MAAQLTTTAIAPAVTTLIVSTGNAAQDTTTLTTAGEFPISSKSGVGIISSLAAVESVSTTNAQAASYSALIYSTPESYINTPHIQVNQGGGDLPGMVIDTLKIVNLILIIIFCKILIVLVLYSYN